ncbi:TonB-dependent siderophore receptor [Pseudomonas sp. ABC1]|uniref:TonB-dependent siderophore receptor n=1 Tax=Pseudomonas sp. ABC1 TaxID=2748080 RepID=UPI0015C3EFA2|nr:TonB-dependent siderophore receptor [Pseudomonas sp. ABC1]QLF92880.1 TonB-dependent siderophore receptor [Pseudomonas sp. ABC1]
MHIPRLRPNALALAVTISLAHLPLTALADTQSYALPSAPLEQTLRQIARQSGQLIAADPALLQGKRSAPVHGQLETHEAVRQALAGSGLQLLTTESGAISVQPVAQGSALELGATSVTSTSIRGAATTEGTGSYTTGSTSTATKMNLSIRETPQSISVVTRQRMDDQNLTSITKVLEQTPGVTISRDAAERFNIYSRGQQISEYQFDGLTTHVENATQNMPQNLADMSIYDRIEVVRGATGLLTGAGVPSGVVNMIRKKPTKEFQASLSSSVGHWDDYRGQVDVSSPLIENGKLRARFVGAKQENDSFVDGYSQERDVIYGVTESDITDSTTIRVGIDYQKYESHGSSGVPLMYSNGEQTNFSHSTTVASKHGNMEFETTNYFFNIDQELKHDWKLVVAGNYMDVDREGKNIANIRANASASVNKNTNTISAYTYSAIIANQTQKSASISLQGPFQLIGREHQAIIGYEYSNYRDHYDSYGYRSATIDISKINNMKPTSNNLYLYQDYKIIQKGYYTALRLKPIEDLHIIIGARASDYKYDFQSVIPASNYSGRTSYNKIGEVTPYAGLVYDLTPEQSIYISYTDIFTPNNVNDINGKVIAPQIGSNYEAGWKGEFYNGRLNANLAIYQINRDNATELAGYDSSNVAYYRAIDGMETKGLDIEIAGEILPDWNFSGSYSHSRSENSDGTRRTTEHPLDTLKLWSIYNFSGEWQKLTIGGGARWSSKMVVDYAALGGKAIQGDYVVIDAMARYKVNQDIAITLNINNLLNEEYYSAIGNLGVGYYGSPRNLTIGARYDF